MVVPTKNIGSKILLAPATSASGFGEVFTVGDHSVVCLLTTDTDEDAGVADALELYTVLEFVKDTGEVTLSYATKEIEPISATSYGFLLGSTNTQAEIMIRGTYAWKKIEITTPAIGVEGIKGLEHAW
jgi:hypothetical protein